MAWVATDANGKEFLFIEKPYRSGYGEYGYWNPTYSGIGGCILIHLMAASRNSSEENCLLPMNLSNLDR